MAKLVQISDNIGLKLFLVVIFYILYFKSLNLKNLIYLDFGSEEKILTNNIKMR